MTPCDCTHWRRPPSNLDDDESPGPGCRHPGQVNPAATPEGELVREFLAGERQECQGRRAR